MTNTNLLTTTRTPKPYLFMPPKRPFKPLKLPLDALLTHQRWIAGPGTGKSTGIARTVLSKHFFLGLPIICIDPTGALASYLITLISLYPSPIRKKLWERFFYVDVGATDYVVPMPLYFRQRPDDSLFTIASRFVEVIELSDPSLSTGAPVEGLNALTEIGIYAGMIIQALNENCQITEVADLIRHPKRYEPFFDQAVRAYPELNEAVSYFRNYISITNPAIRSRQSRSFLNKLVPILSDPAMLATFATSGSIDFDEAVKKRQAVFFDFRDVTNPKVRQFKMLWVFNQVYQFLLSRGIAGRQNPILFVIDEISDLQGGDTENSALAKKISTLTSVFARNYGVKLVYAHQSLSQLDHRIQTALAQMGTQVIGAVQDPDDAHELARQLTRYNPSLVRKKEPIYFSTHSSTDTEGESMHDPLTGAGWQKSTTTTTTSPTIIDYTTTEFTADEQYTLSADLIKSVPKGDFIVRPALREGDVTGRVYLMRTNRIFPALYPDEDLVSFIRYGLRINRGYPVKTLNAAITDRLKQPLTASVILPDNAQEQERDLPATEEEADDDSWRDEFEERIPRTPEIAQALKTRQTAFD